MEKYSKEVDLQSSWGDKSLRVDLVNEDERKDEVEFATVRKFSRASFSGPLDNVASDVSQ